MSHSEKIDKAIEILYMYGSIDGAHHKQWVIDQIARVLTGEDYEMWVHCFEFGEDGPKTYEWDVGVAP